MAAKSPEEYGLILVTGASGFVASHVVKLLLEEGYKVRGTVRSLSNEDKVAPIKNLVPDAKYPIELVEADLLNEDSWKEAVKGCSYVMHVASPFPNAMPKSEDDVIKPAVDGTLAVLKAASESGSVKRVVLTSSIAAIYDPIVPIEKKEGEEITAFDEEVWLNTEDPRLEPYGKSKALAEKAAWDFVKQLPEDKKIELAAINPGMVVGPVLSKNLATSVELIKRLLDKSTPAVPKMHFSICDVRDVAQAHLKAMIIPEAAGHRHIISSREMWVKDIALVLQKELKQHGYFVPTINAPNILVWLSSFVDKPVKLVVPRLGREYKFNNKRMVEVLGITPIDAEKSIVDTAYSLINLGVIKKTRKLKKNQDAPADAPNEAAQVNGEAEGGDKNQELEPEEKEKKDAVAPVEAKPQEIEVAN